MNILGRLAVAMLPLALTAGAMSAQAQCTQQGSSGNEIVGTLLGAAVGGLLGSQVGSGTGNKIAIGAGVLAGGMIGNRTAAAMSCKDQRYHNTAARDAFETHRAGTTSSWVNPDSGHSGSVTPVRTYQKPNGTYCRDFQQTINVEGQYEQAQGTACRQPDGTWQIVSSQ